MLIAGMMRMSGASIGEADALTVPAVRRGRNMLCSPAALPVELLDAENNVEPSPLLRQIDPDVANVVTIAQTFQDMVMRGTSWWKVTAKDFAGFPISARHLDFGSVTVNPPDGRTPAPLPSGIDPRAGVVWVDGVQTSGTEVIRFDSPNPAVCMYAGREIRRALLLQQAAGMYADDPRPMDYFAAAENTDDMEDDEVTEFLDEWKAYRKARSTAYVPKSVTYHTVDQPAPRDLQLVELSRQASLDIANAMGIDPEDLGISTTSRTYANDVDRRRNRLNDVHMPYISAFTQRLSMGDVTRRGYTVRINVSDYLQPNPTERWGVYDTAVRIKAMTVDEVRAKEKEPPMPKVDDDPAPPAVQLVPPLVEARPPMPAVDELDAGATMARRPVDRYTFDAPTARHFVSFPMRSFRVDVERRIIEGVAVPYGDVALNRGMRIRFAPGNFRFAETSRVKLLVEHDTDQAVGHATDLVDTADGTFWTRFKVERTPEGDRALTRAEDQVLDGLSVGVDFEDTDLTLGPDGVFTVNRSDLLEVSLTALPGFDNARVTRVMASRTQGAPLTEPATPPAGPPPPPATPPPPPAASSSSSSTPPASSSTPAPVTFSAEQVRTIVADAIATFARDNTPDVVNPTRGGTGVGRVTEPEPYRFARERNGERLLVRGTHEFSSDVFLAYRGDQVARERVETWIRAQFDATTTTDVAGLNPVGYRPDMYVDQRSFRYPVWEAISKGTLADSTPFVFPKFAAATTVVAAHVQGTEPTILDFTATNQTVTPAAISGKAEVNREVIDAGGNPQVSNLIWRQMTKGWYEALEAAAVALLDAASPTSLGTLTAGGGTTGQTLAAELKALMMNLHFVRGGFSMNDAFAQVDLYKALGSARDGQGRPLFPAIGPSNADGTVQNKVQQIDVNGVGFIPTWALAATGAVVASSYLFDRESVHGWASAPQRLDFDTQVKSVFIGLWGYQATAISDITGVREILYDPVA
jgi:HK97 family phage prohead protease